ncbi:hypothetical protein J3Q64DRAFT_1693577 [Phycomyces blakesleeanus]|uniref:Uncharacterized protein n=1 Tax=Phycomyces blakesleeanus TaxID=4837 RepID=A0ABR3BH34_PHYBL
MSSFPVAWILILITPYTPQSSSQILAELLRHIFQLAGPFKEVQTTRQLEDVFAEEKYRNSFMAIFLIWTAYLEKYRLKQSSIYHNSKHERVRGCYVIIDAGIRCIIYCMYEDSTLEVTNWYLYPSSWHRFRLNSVKFCIILNLKAQPQNVIAVEYEIFQTSRRTNNIADFTFYTLVKAADSSMTTSFYVNIIICTS